MEQDLFVSNEDLSLYVHHEQIENFKSKVETKTCIKAKVYSENSLNSWCINVDMLVLSYEEKKSKEHCIKYQVKYVIPWY